MFNGNVCQAGKKGSIYYCNNNAGNFIFVSVSHGKWVMRSYVKCKNNMLKFLRHLPGACIL